MMILFTCFNETGGFFSDNNPLWEFLSLVIVASIGLITVYIQHNLNRKKERKKLASEIASDSGRLASLLISRYRSFAENYFSSQYFYGVLRFFSDLNEKQSIISHAEEAKSTWTVSQKEFQEIMAEISKLLHRWSIQFGQNENITRLLVEQREVRLPERPNYSACTSRYECMKMKRTGDRSFEATIDRHAEIMNNINSILVNEAQRIQEE